MILVHIRLQTTILLREASLSRLPNGSFASSTIETIRSMLHSLSLQLGVRVVLNWPNLILFILGTLSKEFGNRILGMIMAVLTSSTKY